MGDGGAAAEIKIMLLRQIVEVEGELLRARAQALALLRDRQHPDAGFLD